MIFLQPLFLFGLLTVSIPIIIHLFQFRRYKTVYFTNVAFLRNLKKETEKQSKLKHLLVLLARILAIAALVMAFAQPVIPEQEEAKSALKAKNYVSIYVDNSRSMQQQSAQGSVLSKARAKALEIVDTYPATAKFQFLSNDFKAYHQRFIDKSGVKTMIEETDISPAARNLSEVMSRQKQLFRNEAGGMNKHVYLISDFQKSSADIQNISADSSFDVNLVKVNATQPNNLYVDSCWFEEPVHQVQQTSVLHVSIRNSGAKDYEKIPLKLKIGGKQRALASFSVKAGDKVQTELSFTNHKTGWHLAQLEIVDNPITFDDTFYFSYEIKPAIHVLEIYEDQPNSYLGRLFDRDSLIAFSTSDVLKLNYSSIADNQLIILNEIASFSSGLSQTLKKNIAEGRSDLVLIPHKEKMATNKQITEELNLSRLGSLDSSATEVGDIATAHPLYENVFMEKVSLSSDKNFDLPSVQKYFTIQTRPSAEVLMRLVNNNPFFVTENRGAATIYQLAAPLKDDFTNFQRHALFVPTFHRMAIMSQKGGKIFHYTADDEPVSVPLSATDEGDEVMRLEMVDGEYEIIPPVSDGPGGIQFENKVEKAGHYQILYNDSIRGYLSFNYNRLESDMEMMSTGELSAASKDNIKTTMTIYDDNPQPLSAQIKENQAGYPLWRWFVIMALVFLGLEVLFLRFLK